MKVHLKILLIFLLTGFALIPACKKQDSTAEEDYHSISPGHEAESKELLPVQIGTGSNRITLTYTKDHSPLKLVYGNGDSTLIEYDAAGNPEIFYQYRATSAFTVSDCISDKEGRIAEVFQYDSRYISTGGYQFSYDQGSLIRQISYYDRNFVYYKYATIRYDQKGNQTSAENPFSSQTAVYTYDNHAGVFSHVKNQWLLRIAENQPLYLSCVNNILTCSDPSAALKDQRFSYTYNKDGYPETVRMVINGAATTLKITYKEME